VRFRITAIAYVFALVAAAMATFGGWGLLFAAMVLLHWLWIAKAPTPSARLLIAIATAALISIMALIAAMIPPAVRSARTSSCLGRLAQMKVAILSYESSRGALPQAITLGADGTPAHSWRVPTTTYMEWGNLYMRYKKTEPWNGLHNAKLLSSSIHQYICPSHSDTRSIAQYFAIVDPRTAWPPDRGRRLDEIKDGAMNTILLIEAPHKNVPWTKPEDLSFDEAVELLSGDQHEGDAAHLIDNGPFFKPTRAGNVAFVDGRAETLRLPLPRDVAIALLTVDGGEEFYREALDRYAPPRRLDLARCYALAAFVGLSLAPAFALLRGRRDAAGSPAAR
jgi:Protein of unknown function (DUF1559)